MQPHPTADAGGSSAGAGARARSCPYPKHQGISASRIQNATVGPSQAEPVPLPPMQRRRRTFLGVWRGFRVSQLGTFRPLFQSSNLSSAYGGVTGVMNSRSRARACWLTVGFVSLFLWPAGESILTFSKLGVPMRRPGRDVRGRAAIPPGLAPPGPWGACHMNEPFNAFAGGQ